MDISQITETLYMGRTPKSEDYALLHGLGIRLVINMRWDRSPYPDPAPEPMPVLWLRTFDSWLIPIPVAALHRGVQRAREVLQDGGRVYVHCGHGKHRAAAMGCAILVAEGMQVEKAMRLMKERRAAADPYAWHIRRQIEAFAREWKKLTLIPHPSPWKGEGS